jgi:hypothetical protein
VSTISKTPCAKNYFQERFMPTQSKTPRAKLQFIIFISGLILLIFPGCEPPENRQQTIADPPATTSTQTPPVFNRQEIGLLYPASQPLKLTAQTTRLPEVKIALQQPEIIGFEYEIQATGKQLGLVRPSYFYAYDEAGKEIRKDWIDYRYGELGVSAGAGWSRGRFEVMLMPEVVTVVLELTTVPLTLTSEQVLKIDQPHHESVAKVSSAKPPTILLRNFRIIKGGFAPEAIFPGAPYLPWIANLKADRTFASKMSFADASLQNLAPKYLWAYWTPKIALSKTEPEHWRRELQPYLDLSLVDLLAVFPKNPPILKIGLNFKMSDSLSVDGFTWSPARPDELCNKDGKWFWPDKEFVASGNAEYLAPNGQRGVFAYREAESKGDHHKLGGGREYRDAKLTQIKVCSMLRAAFALAVFHRVTGEQKYAERAGVILAAFARAVPGWPNFGTGEGAEKQIPSPQAPHDYNSWFSFVLGGWYTPSTGTMTWLAKTYDLIKEAPVWEAVDQALEEDGRDRIASGFLHVMRESLRRDAYFRFLPFRLYHNTTGGQINAMIAVGRAIGCPELIHYAVNKLDQAVRHYVMADGSFPETPTYGHDQIISYNKIYQSLTGYSDPAGFVSRLDGKRFDTFSALWRYPLFDRAVEMLDRQVFPDGSIWSLADSWPENPKPAIAHPAKAWFMSDFGHAVLGRGEKSDAIEAHLEYSGFDNHSHKDTLNLTLWAYGDELVSDIGYTHFGGYPSSAINHNLVVVDGRNQNFFLIRRNDLMTWSAGPDLSQVAQVQQGNPPSNPQASVYRRSLISIPFGLGREAVLDLFEVQGGKRHEWMANGSATYAQELSTSLVPGRTLASLAPDGKVMTDPHRFKVHLPAPGGERLDDLYGVFRNAKVGKNDCPWQATLTAAPPVAPGTPGAFARAMSKEAKPGLRLHWLAPLDGEAIFCEAPRHRYANESSIWGKDADFTKWWNENLMQKIIVRREGNNLDSLFFAIWEPFKGGQQAWLDQVTSLPLTPADSGTAALLRSGNDAATVIYRKPECAKELSTGDLHSSARFVIHRRVGDWEYLELIEGKSVATDYVGIELTPWPELRILGQGQSAQSEYYLEVSGDLSAYPPSATQQPHAGMDIRFQQSGQAAWWLPLVRIENPGKTGARLIFNRELGFQYDSSSGLLEEKFYPYRTTGGKATITLPLHAALKWRFDEPKNAKVLSSGPALIRRGSNTTPVPPTVGWQDLEPTQVKDQTGSSL